MLGVRPPGGELLRDVYLDKEVIFEARAAVTDIAERDRGLSERTTEGGLDGLGLFRRRGDCRARWKLHADLAIVGALRCEETRFSLELEDANFFRWIQSAENCFGCRHL